MTLIKTYLYLYKITKFICNVPSTFIMIRGYKKLYFKIYKINPHHSFLITEK